MSNKSLKFNTIINTIRLIILTLVPLITFPYTSRIFLTEGNGQISYVTSVVQVFILFASLGVYNYGIREGSKVRDDKRKFSKLALELFIINIVATLITYILFILMLLYYPNFESYRLLFLINGISIGFTALGLDWIYGVYEEYKYITLRQIIVQIFTVATMFLFVHDKCDIYIWMTLLTISTVGANIFNFIYARRYFCKINEIVSIKLKIHIKPVLILFATALAARVYMNLDTILLGTFTTDHNTGLYSAAVKVNTMLITLFSAMTPVFIPRLIESLRTNNDGYHLLLKKVFSLIFSLCIPAVICLEVLTDQMIEILAGPSFADAAFTMRILAPVVLITSCANIIYNNVLIIKGKESNVLLCTVVGAIVNLIVSLILISSLKENGTAIGSLLAETVALIVAILFSVREDRKLKMAIPKVLNYIIGSLAMIGTCYLIKYFCSSAILVLFLAPVLSGIIYVMILIILKDPVANELLVIVNKLITKIKKRGVK